MAIVSRHECGQPKSDTAKACPHCGARRPYTLWKQNLLALILIPVFILIAFVILGWLA
jgi:hypothetical protein